MTKLTLLRNLNERKFAIFNCLGVDWDVFYTKKKSILEDLALGKFFPPKMYTNLNLDFCSP